MKPKIILGSDIIISIHRYSILLKYRKKYSIGIPDVTFVPVKEAGHGSTRDEFP